MCQARIRTKALLDTSRPKKLGTVPHGAVPCIPGDDRRNVPPRHSRISRGAKSTYNRSSHNGIKTYDRYLTTTNLFNEGPPLGTPDEGLLCRSSATPNKRGHPGDAFPEDGVSIPTERRLPGGQSQHPNREMPSLIRRHRILTS